MAITSGAATTTTTVQPAPRFEEEEVAHLHITLRLSCTMIMYDSNELISIVMNIDDDNNNDEIKMNKNNE